MEKRMNIALVGEESAGVRALNLVMARGDARTVIVLSSGRGGVASLSGAARAIGVHAESTDRVSDPAFAHDLRVAEVDILLNVHSLRIAHSTVVAAPRVGSFNLHPGPLPTYAGLNAPSWAIYERAGLYGCTVHWMSADIDAGPIAYVAEVPIFERDTGLTLTARCVREGIPLLGRLLDDARRGGATAIPRVEQSEPAIDRGSGPPHEGRVPWSLSAERIAAFVRASDYGPFASPWGRPRAVIDGAEVELLQTSALSTSAPAEASPGEVIGVEEAGVLVAAGEGVLRISRLARQGKPIKPAELARPGARFSA